MDDGSRLLGSATPRFAKMIGSKYARMSAEGVEQDFKENHGRKVSSHYVQELFDKLGDVMRHREEMWTYAPTDLKPEMVSHVGLGVDGTTTAIIGEGYKETMCGTISFYGHDDNRLGTIYLGCAPEKNKVAFESLFAREVALVKKKFPDALYVALADGTHRNWDLLGPMSDIEVQDFFHVTEYLKNFADAAFGAGKKSSVWQETHRTILRDQEGGAQTILDIMRTNIASVKHKERKEKIQSAITYFENHLYKMQYALYQKLCIPIGSGVTEAACKTFVKQRLSLSGMRWKTQNVDDILLARALILTQDRWQKFWNKCDRFGYLN